MTTRPATGPGWGYLCIVTAAVLWAISGSSAKFLFNRGITPFAVVQTRLTLAAAVLLGWLFLRRRDLLVVARRDVFYFAALGIFGVALNQFTYLFTISRINVAAAILLQYLGPSLIAIYLVTFARERLSRLTVAAIVGATIGCYLVVGAYRLSVVQLNGLGIASGLLSAVSFAAYSLMSEYGMRRYNPWTVLLFAFGFAAVVWNLLHPPLSGFRGGYGPLEWLWIGYIGILGTLVPFGLYLEGINRVRATRASVTATLEPITAGVFSYICLGETMAPLQIFGGVLVIGSVILLQIRRELDTQAPARIRARAAELEGRP